MSYHQLTSQERYALSALRRQGLSQAAIARTLGRHRSTISRELKRNTRKGVYRPSKAHKWTRGRRRRSHRNRRFTASQWQLVVGLLEEQQWSPEQIAGRLREAGRLRISHESIYRYVWADQRRGGALHRHLRGAQKQRRKRYGRYDSRGRLAGKRPITERPPEAESRSRAGHLEGDTVLGTDRHCILTLVDRKTGYVLIGKLAARTVEAANERAIALLARAPRRTRTLTLDNGTEFHGYRTIERATGAVVYFATPHHSWERGTNENTNGLIRQYVPKRTSMARLTQDDCDRIADKLNNRPRKRLGYLTPKECYEKNKKTK